MDTPKLRVLRAKLTRLTSTNTNIDEVNEGTCVNMPCIGEQFILYMDIPKGGIVTSVVQSINLPEFTTLNSTYNIEVLTEELE